MKKRLASASFALLAALLLGSCEFVIELVDTGGGGGASTRTFNAYDMVTGSNYEITATLRATGDQCLVYVENAELDAVDSKMAEAVASEFDANIYSTIRNAFGAESDVDGNGKIILLLLDIRDGATATSGYVAGYFDPTNLYDKSVYPASNEADMISLDLNPGVAGSAGFYSTIAHEFQHMINFWTTVSADGTQQDVWINEGLSSAAEYLYSGAQVQEKIAWYNNAPSHAGYSDIQNGNNFFVWSNDAYVLDEYATVYLFFQWLRIHAGNESGIYRDILNNSNGYRDYRTVVAAAAARIDPGLSDWGAILRTWLGANVLNVADKGASLGLYGYGGEISTTPTLASGTLPLAPGEGVVFDFSTSFTQAASGNIRYAGFSSGSSPAVDLTGDDYSGNYGIAFNVNTDSNAAAENGVAASLSPGSVAAALRPASRTAAAFAPPASYPISVILQPGGAFHPDSHRPAGSAAQSRALDSTVRTLRSLR